MVQLISHCSEPKSELEDVRELLLIMSCKSELKNGTTVKKERGHIQDVIAALHKISERNGYEFDESLFKIEEEEEVSEVSSASDESDQQIKQKE